MVSKKTKWPVVGPRWQLKKLFVFGTKDSQLAAHRRPRER